jgi:hypothetical protein
MAEQTNLVCLKEGTKKAIDKTFIFFVQDFKNVVSNRTKFKSTKNIFEMLRKPF